MAADEIGRQALHVFDASDRLYSFAATGDIGASWTAISLSVALVIRVERQYRNRRARPPLQSIVRWTLNPA
ncbi:hypothetical protein, partial [Burkholderia sp.]|uniref:hypothetical protein n=1 Tax=Burkholderia sp. TaxID=36773 RepID=UPI00258E7D0A